MRKILKALPLLFLLPILYCRYFFLYGFVLTTVITWKPESIGIHIVVSAIATCFYSFILGNCRGSKSLTQFLARMLRVTYQRHHIRYISHVAYSHWEEVNLIVFVKEKKVIEETFKYAIAGSVLYDSEAVERREAIRLYLKNL